MARKSNIQITAESALQNLNCIHELAQDGGGTATYIRNAPDCERWVRSIQAAKMPLPAWLAGNRFLGVHWRFTA